MVLDDHDRQMLLRLARRTLMDFISMRRKPPLPPLTPALQEPRAVFVTLWRRDSGELRGCRGEIVAHDPLAQAVVEMAIAAATDDPRFLPVTVDEIPLLSIEISVLTPLYPIAASDVVIGKHGVLVSRGARRGLLLPQVATEHGMDREEFLDAVCQKAGLPAHAWRAPDTRLSAFETTVFEENP
ncbi:MAG: AmmeMemoRadiSam system protein A [Anaerolineales bacterium]|nr:AmmeMemoRadiSam system protein A [Anaerolineales bacterium]